MKNILLILLVIVSCTPPKLEQVSIKYRKNKKEIIINNKSDLILINSLIKDKKQEPNIFMTIYELELKYHDGHLDKYSCQGKYLRDRNGKTYTLVNDEMIEKYLSLTEAPSNE